MKKIGILLLCTLLPLLPLGAKKKVHGPEIPILAWYSIPGGKFATEEHYQELKDCGFTYSFAHIYKYEDAIQALDLCAKVGLKSIFMCPRMGSSYPESGLEASMLPQSVACTRIT